MPRVLVVMLLMIAACGKTAGDGGGAASDPQAVARAFVEAMTNGDLDKARGMLLTDEACAGQPGTRGEHCKRSAKAMRDQLGSLVDDFPRGAHVTGIKKSADQLPGVDVWTVELDGKSAAEIMTVSMGGRVYPTFAVKRQQD
jgi:hypothetical protein